MRPIMISPIGQPGSGKSTFSLGLAHALKRAGIHTEFVPEVIKHDVFTPEGVARVTSGKFDSRYLRLQHAAAKGFLEQAEVVVNDGCLEPFYYYSKGRVDPDHWPAYEKLLERLRRQQAVAEHRFVTLDLELNYSHAGRHQDQSEALALRQPLLDCLKDHYGIEPVVLTSQSEIDHYTSSLAQEVLELREQLQPKTRKPGF